MRDLENIHATWEKIFSLAGRFERTRFSGNRYVSACFRRHTGRPATPASAVSASLSLFLAGFAAAQLLWGPLSDRYGRKPVLLIGLTIFALGSLGMLWVENAATLLVLRFVQAVGVCAAAVIWQALVTDYYPSQKVNRIFATIMPLVGLSPALAPLLGSWLLVHFSWQRYSPPCLPLPWC